LRNLIATGDHRLDTILGTITDAARQLTGASGAALAMWKDGAMVCRARSGETAPALGARLSAETGISGECLRTGKLQHCLDTENDPLVDVEVCRSLGLRSIAVLPIQGWRGINGILEVFSTRPAAFTEQHIVQLQQLASLAERARASQPHGASTAAPRPAGELQRRQRGLLPASDPVGDVALAFVDRRRRPLVLGAIGCLAIALLALVIWLGWRGQDAAGRKAVDARPSSLNAASRNDELSRPPGHDPVWKSNSAGESLSPSREQIAAGNPLKFAAKVDVIAGKNAAAARGQNDRPERDRGSLLADVAANIALPREAASAQTEARSTDSRSDETAAQPPPIPAGSMNQSALSGVLSAKASMPGLSAPRSQGVSGGQLARRVEPVYPAQARERRLEGSVVLAATIMEDGTVRNVKIVKGPPILAEAAVSAVQNWRYKPFELDGKPVKNETRIVVEFKLPGR